MDPRVIAHLSLKIMVINIIMQPVRSSEDKILYSHHQKDRTVAFLRK